MKIVVIGGCHVGNYGIPPHHGFVQQWANYLTKKMDQPVAVTSLSMVKLNQVSSLITQYHSDLTQADYIVLQLGHYELSWRKKFRYIFQNVPVTEAKANCMYCPKTFCSHPPRPMPRQEQLKNTVKAALLRLCKRTNRKLPILDQVTQSMVDTFIFFTPFREKMIVMTPFPSLNAVDQWLRSETASVIAKAALNHKFQVINTFHNLPRHTSAFLADGVHLNEKGHAAVASLLENLPISIELLTNFV